MMAVQAVAPLPGMDAIFAALADPTRRAILERLIREGERIVGELAQPFRISLPAISRHLRVLENAGLVRRRTERQWRYYAADPAALRAVAGWVEAHRAFWSTSFDRLDQMLADRPE
jgi:DNA-binding transcriptional ArsR family regulator